MMHHPNMHHQPMSGHPPQHMPGHQGMPGHHQMPPHQLHRESRHVPLTRVPLGPSQPGGGMGPGQAMGGMGGMGVPHHPPTHRPPHPIRAMPHHPQTQHHSVPPQMKQMRRPYAYGPGSVLRPPYALPPHVPPAPPAPPVSHAPHPPPIPPVSTVNANVKANAPITPSVPSVAPSTAGATSAAGELAGAEGAAAGSEGEGAAGDVEAARSPAQANSKEKTPMCLVNELARYNKVKHQYRLTSEMGPAHKKIFTVTLRLGDTEEYTAEGTSIKRAQHAAASAALASTRYPPPPPRAAPHHHHHPHHRNAGAVMPTVELNALAMKLCQPALYTSLPPLVSHAAGGGRGRGACRGQFAQFARVDAPDLVYRVRVAVGGRAWLGAADTPQGARHDAAARALHDLRPKPDMPDLAPQTDAADGSQPATAEASADLLNSEVKSPVSLVHELALKRNLSVHFSVKSERGPPHMRVFVTVCTVGEMETEGEGNGKKVSKRRAASRMLEEMRRRWPPALLRARPDAPPARRPHSNKKKPRNLIKEGVGVGGCGSGAEGGEGADNPISRLAAARHVARARSPQYRVVEERGAARRREFLVQCDAPPHCATGLGPNKKAAKRRAAHNVLVAMELETNPAPSSDDSSAPVDQPVLAEGKRKEGPPGGGGGGSVGGGGGGGAETRQPVPGVLLMDYHSRTGQPQQHNGISETSATGGSGGNTPGAKAHLMYLSQLLGFTVQFSDFPKRNHGEYLSLVSLSTEPPVICHGAGTSTEHSHELSARHALRTLARMGLDPPVAPLPQPAMANLPGTTGKASVITNGVAE